MPDRFIRTELLLGPAAMEALTQARVIVFGIGGVGGYAAEALARAGVGALDLVDNDQVSLTNINRQIVATTSTIGRDKVDVMAERIRDINPSCQVTVHKCFYLPATAQQFDLSAYDYVIDAVDTVTAKLQLITQAQESGARIISSMGAGNKMDPTAFEVADISRTSVCPLAKIIRKELRKRGINHVKVVYSKEPPRKPYAAAVHEPAKPADSAQAPASTCRRDTPASSPFTPPTVGLIIASEVVKDLIANIPQPDESEG